MLGDLPQEPGQDSNCPRPLLVKPLWGEGLASPAAGTQRNGGSAFRQAGWWGYPPTHLLNDSWGQQWERMCSFMQGESDPGNQKAQTRRLEQKKGVSAK